MKKKLTMTIEVEADTLTEVKWYIQRMLDEVAEKVAAGKYGRW